MNNETPEQRLFYAVKTHNIDEVEYIIVNYKQININAIDGQNFTPLHWAIKSYGIIINDDSNISFNQKIKNKKIISLLFQHPHINIYAETNKEETILHLIAKIRSQELCDFLLQKLKSRIIIEQLFQGNSGWFINKKDNKGKTALHYAACNGDYEIAKLLVKHGADWKFMDNHDSDAVDCANRNGHDAVVQLLLNSPRNIFKKLSKKHDIIIRDIAIFVSVVRY